MPGFRLFIFCASWLDRTDDYQSKNPANYGYFSQDHEIAARRQWLTLKQAEKPKTVAGLAGFRRAH
jgi:hypothetical protein